MSDAIIVFTTGGTFDALAPDVRAIGAPTVPELLLAGRATLAVHCVELMRRDSSLLTPADRALIRDAVVECPLSRIVLVHGTDTLMTTAAALAGIADKVIVLTGAFIPARAPPTDAAFNLGGALIAVQLLPPGVHVCIGAELYAAGDCAKDSVCRRFRRSVR
jgi:L-asparaginase